MLGIFIKKTAFGYNKTSDYTHPDNKIGASFSPSFEIGFGAKLNTKSSIELMLHFLNHDFRGSTYYKNSYVVQENFGTSNVDIDAYIGLSNKIKTRSILLNYKYDLLDSTQNIIVPFGFIRVGLAINKSNDFIYDIHKERYVSIPTGEKNKIIYPGKISYSFAWQLGAGFKIICNEKIDLEFIGRYYDYGKSTSEIGSAYNKTNDEKKGFIKQVKSTNDTIGTKIRGFGGSIGLIWKF